MVMAYENQAVDGSRFPHWSVVGGVKPVEEQYAAIHFILPGMVEMRIKMPT